LQRWQRDQREFEYLACVTKPGHAASERAAKRVTELLGNDRNAGSEVQDEWQTASANVNLEHQKAITTEIR
jgi:hypothetical protein